MRHPVDGTSEVLSEAPEGEPGEHPLVTVWARYANHVRPPARANQPACGACCDADKPTSGCETGVALYNAYRLARIA